MRESFQEVVSVTKLEEFAWALSKTLCPGRGGDYRVSPAYHSSSLSRCASLPTITHGAAPGDRPSPLVSHHDRFDHEDTLLLDAPVFYVLIDGLPKERPAPPPHRARITW